MPANRNISSFTVGTQYIVAATLCLLSTFIVFVSEDSYALFAPDILPIHLTCTTAGLIIVGAAVMGRSLVSLSDLVPLHGI